MITKRIKEYLMKLCNLYSENTKKLRSLKDLIDELSSLLDWHDGVTEHVGQGGLGVS